MSPQLCSVYKLIATHQDDAFIGSADGTLEIHQAQQAIPYSIMSNLADMSWTELRNASMTQADT